MSARGAHSSLAPPAEPAPRDAPSVQRAEPPAATDDNSPAIRAAIAADPDARIEHRPFANGWPPRSLNAKDAAAALAGPFKEGAWRVGAARFAVRPVVDALAWTGAAVATASARLGDDGAARLRFKDAALPDGFAGTASLQRACGAAGGPLASVALEASCSNRFRCDADELLAFYDAALRAGTRLHGAFEMERARRRRNFGDIRVRTDRGAGSRRRRGARRGYSEEAGRGAAAGRDVDILKSQIAAPPRDEMWIFRGAKSRRRRGARRGHSGSRRDADIPLLGQTSWHRRR